MRPPPRVQRRQTDQNRAARSRPRGSRKPQQRSLELSTQQVARTVATAQLPEFLPATLLQLPPSSLG